MLWAWYCWAADYGYSAVAGTYVFVDNGQQSVLVLLDNRVFRQELRRSGRVARAQGTWRRVGEGGVVFSKELLKVPGQKLRQDGQADGRIEKSFGGFFTSVVFEGDESGPVFRKRVFR